MLHNLKIVRTFGALGKLKKVDRIKNKHISLKPITQSHQYQDFVGTTSYQQARINLSPNQQRLIQTKAMQRPYTGMLWSQKTTGFYHCAVCDTRLFTYDHKFDTKTGYATFWKAVTGRVNIINQQVQFEDVNYARQAIGKAKQQNHQRCECAICHSHLGAVFFDGPPPTFTRFTINSALLKFKAFEDFPDPNIKKKAIKQLKQKEKVEFL